MKNALSIDLECYYSNEFLIKYLPKNLECGADDASYGLLKLLDKYNIKATFFVLGILAEKYPDYIRMLYEAGHEIGSHSYSHKTLHKLGKDQFEEELSKSTDILRSITHEQPIGFRAPSFSVDKNTSWVFGLLKKYGYKYDTSIFPFKTMLYGVPDAPLAPYIPSIDDISKHDPEGEIIEFPMAVIKIWKNIPIAGGFYLRVLPSWFLKFAIGQVNKKRPVVIYVHPWETFKDTPRLKVPLHIKFEAYHGINSALFKLEELLKEFEFAPVREVLDL
ncbi:MAG: polysaccharide deacetylase family protein [Candidatus Methanoperedens sp.]|nr:polysaccharide deacetylase family protein [Candidatus Methanoperedens sp.]